MDHEEKSLSGGTSSKVLLSKLRKYGWGWIILLFCFARDYAARGDPLSDYTLSFIWDMLFFAFMFLYFVLRRSIAAKWCTQGRHTWQAGCAAGLLTYFAAALVLGVMAFFDSRSLCSDIASLDDKYRERLASLTQEDERICEEFVVPPQTPSETARSVELVDEALLTLNRRSEVLHEMFDDYKKFGTSRT